MPTIRDVIMAPMEITIFAILVWFTAIFVGSITLVIFLGSNKLSSRAFAFSIFLLAVWITEIGFLIATNDPQIALIITRIGYYSGSVIATSFLYFFFTFPDNKRPPGKLVLSLIILQFILCYLFIFTDKVIQNISQGGFITRWWWNFGSLSYVFEVSFFGFFILGVIILYHKLKNANHSKDKTNLRYMLISIIVGVIPPGILSIVLPRFGYHDVDALGAISQIIWVPIIAYSIVRHGQMSVRVVFTEVLAIGMAAIFFINIFVTEPLGIWPRVIAFTAFLILAYYLIRGVLREAKQREQLNDLNQHLSQRVAEQTVEIRKSYEAEKKARMELEKLNDAKDQFIMITQHHLRTPLVSVIWGLESVLNNAHGAVSSQVREVITGMKASTDRLMQIVNDFLSITAIKIGTNILNLSEQSLKPTIEYIVRQLQPEAKHMNVAVSYPEDDGNWPKLKLDHDKMREILLIILENAIRYNHAGGTVDISTATRAGTFELVVGNTGIGISDEEKQKIGSALFYRGQSARRSHPIGMGIGLAVVKAIVRAHHGNFEIKSSGQGHGARVMVSLPLDSR